MESSTQQWLAAIMETVESYRRMIDATVEQLTDAELRARPAPHINSVAILLRHMGGNLKSRWTDFLTTDGEKLDRDRDSEFQDWPGDRDSLLKFFDAGWCCLIKAIQQISDANINQKITIRGEPHTLQQAVTRSITHLSYHVGQIAMVARMVHHGPWKWLTIAPGESQTHNQKTWGTEASRGTFGRTSSET